MIFIIIMCPYLKLQKFKIPHHLNFKSMRVQIFFSAHIYIISINPTSKIFATTIKKSSAKQLPTTVITPSQKNQRWVRPEIWSIAMAQFQNHKRGRFNLLYDVVQFIYIIFLGTFQITSVTKPLFVFAFNSLLLLKNFIHYFVEFIPK